MSFAASVRMNGRKALVRVNRAIYELAKELFTYTVKLTPSPAHPGPYATGYLANQWYPDNNGFSEELGPDSDTSSTGAGSLSRITAMKGSAFLGRDGFVSLTNNTHYAYRAEALGWPIKDGWSGQIGPYRMVALSIQYFKAKHP